MNELALFAGAGGGILGGKLLGWRTVCAVEIDPYARRVLLARQADGCLGRFPIWDDVRTFDGKRCAGRSMSSAEDFPAKTLAQPEREQELPERSPVCCRTWHALSVRFDRDSCSWKTVRCLFPEDLPWSSVILPRWGMMRDGECWERNTTELPIKDTGSGLWPTPVADGDRTTNYAQGGTSLGFAVRNWTTPTVTGNHNRKGASKNSGDGLATVVKNWPTPTSRMLTVGDMEQARHAGNGKTRPTYLMANQSGGTLSPMWVEWLMGWPVGWTDCDALETGKFRQWLDSHGIR